MTAVSKTSLRLSETEAAYTAKLRNPATLEAEAVRELTGLEDLSHAPAATILHALIEAGIMAVKDKAEQLSHARLAEHLKTDDEHKAWRASRRRRAALRHPPGIEGTL